MAPAWWRGGSRANEIVVRNAHDGKHVAELSRNLVGEGLRVEAGVGGRAFHLLAVLVGAAEEMDILAIQPLEAGDDVCGDRGVGVSQVRGAVHVENRRREVVGHWRRHRAAAAGLSKG